MKTLYHNGQFVPMTSEDDTFEALLVADDGTIAFTGSLVEARERAEDASEIDLAGKTVLPGFIDGHSHFTGTTQYLLNPDLSACRSFADIQNVLRDFIQKRGIDENGVVMAIGYDQNALAERRHPTKDVLDEVSRDIPIVVMQASNHMGVANSKALELTGITDELLREEGIGKQAFAELLAALLTPGTMLAAYNAQFDLLFLYAFLQKYGDARLLQDKQKLDLLTVYRDRRAYPHRLCNAIEHV